MLRNKQWVYRVCLFSILVASFLTKILVINRFEAPPSPDYGNYLSQVDILHGFDLRGLGLRYNPLFFVFLDLVLRLFDELLALKLMAAFVFSIIAIPFYLFVRKISGSELVALICTWLFVFFEGYSEMIAWGGNPNFLGFSFMLLTLLLLLDSIEEPSKRNMILTGFFFSLVVGTHLLVAIFLVFLFVFFLGLVWVFDRKNRDRLLRIVLFSGLVTFVFSLPYFPVYATFFRYSSDALVGGNIFQRLDELSSNLAWLFRSQYLIIAIMIGLGIFAMVKYFRVNKNRGLLLCSFFSAPFIIALLTEHPERWFYFLPIPIIACFSLYLKDLFLAIFKAKREILLLAFFFIFLIGAEMTSLSMTRLQVASDFYQTIGVYELKALRWAKANTTLGEVFATSGTSKFEGVGNSYSWWIEGYSDRKCIPTGFMRWFSYQYEKEEAMDANRIFTGTYSAEYSGVRMSICYPSSIGNPQIAASVNGEYQNVVFLRDDKEQLIFSRTGNEQVVLNESSSSAEIKAFDVHYDAAVVNATFTYEWPNMQLTRNIIFGSEKSSVDVAFKVIPTNATLRQFSINLWAANHTILEKSEVDNSTYAIKLYQWVAFGKISTTQITVLQTDGEILNATGPAKNWRTTMPLSTYVFGPLGNGSLNVHIRLSVTTNSSSEATDDTVHFYNSSVLIRDLGIDYIFLNKLRSVEYQRFLQDSEHFTTVFSNEDVIIFKVV
jgi:hypothetical protein